MKRLFLVVMMVGVVLASAAALDINFAIGAQNTGMSINMSQGATGKVSTKVEAGLECVMNMDIEKGHGVNVVFQTDFTKAVGIFAGYAYETKISSTTDFTVAAGPYFVLGSSNYMGVYTRADFDFKIIDDMFARIGTGFDMQLCEFGKGAAFAMTIPIPRVAIGWNF